MLQFIKNIGHVLYRIWFYLLVTVPILIFSPFLIATTLSEKTFHQFYWLARNIWAKAILYGMGCWPSIVWSQKLKKGESYMLISNHTSMLDIMLMFICKQKSLCFCRKTGAGQNSCFWIFLQTCMYFGGPK